MLKLNLWQLNNKVSSSDRIYWQAVYNIDSESNNLLQTKISSSLYSLVCKEKQQKNLTSRYRLVLPHVFAEKQTQSTSNSVRVRNSWCIDFISEILHNGFTKIGLKRTWKLIYLHYNELVLKNQIRNISVV